jgi:hypothetical protein
MPDANYGYGYPFFNFYAPLSIYIGGFFRLLGSSYVLAVKLTQLLGFLVAAWAMFQLGRRWFDNEWAGLLASAAYTLAPFHMVNVYVRGDSLAEFWAMAIFPLVLLGMDRLLNNKHADSGSFLSQPVTEKSGVNALIATLALAYAALILSHNISALIFTPYLLLYVLLSVWSKASSRTTGNSSEGSKLYSLSKPLLALLLALSLSAWFWLPALAEQSLAQLEPVTSGYFHFSNHFRNGDLIQPSFLFDYDVADGRAFRMGLVQALVIGAGLVILVVWGIQKKERRPRLAQILFIVISLLISTFMITSLSQVLWEQLPLLPFTQFPWRFLSVQAFAGALAIAALGLLPGRRIIVPAIIILLLGSALGNLHTDHLLLNDGDISPQKLAEYEWFTGNIGSTVSAEYLPPTVQPRPFTSSWLGNGIRNEVRAIDGELSSFQLLEQRATRQAWRLNTQSESNKLVFPTLYWTGWEAKINGEDAEIASAGGSGLISINLPSGEHIVTLKLTRTPTRLAAELISLVALGTTVWLVRPARIGRPGKRFVAILGFFTFLLLAFRLLPSRVHQDSDLNWDFGQQAYLHHEREVLLFDDGSRLSAYLYDAEEISPGEETVITLDWDTVASDEATLALVSPAVHRFKQAPLLAERTEEIDGGETGFRLTIPENAPSGLYMPRLTLATANLLTESGQRRGDLFLRPIRILDIPQMAKSNHSDLDARVIQAKMRDDKMIDVELQWLTSSPLTQNYNFSLRLVNANGRRLAQFDGQPGYGFLPSSGWLPGQWIDDWLALPLSSEVTVSDCDPCTLVVQLYDVETEVPSLIRRLGDFSWIEDDLVFNPIQPVFDIPEEVESVSVVFDEKIELRGFALDHAQDQLALILYWKGLVELEDDYNHFVHLVDPVNGGILAQHDSMPRQDSYPTSQWSADEIVADPLTLDLADVPDGDYQLLVGLYRNLGDGERFSRLPAADKEGLELAEDQFTLPVQIIVKGQ